jgi:hypothetical protein
MILVGNLVIIFPWEYWVYMNKGQVIALSGGGIPSMMDGLTYGVDRGFRRNHWVSEELKTLMEDINNFGLSNRGKTIGAIAHFLRIEVQRRPITAVKLLGWKAVRSWYGTDSGRFENKIVLIQIVYLVLIGFGAVKMWVQGGVSRKFFKFVSIIVLYFWGMTIIGNSMVRYMVPAMGLLLILIPFSFEKKKEGFNLD